jgi:hypothetical protein
MKKLLCALLVMWAIAVQGSEHPASKPLDIPPRKANSDKTKRLSFSPRALQRRDTISSSQKKEKIKRRDSSEISNSGHTLANRYGQRGDLSSALNAIDGLPARPLSKSERPARRTTSGPTPAVSKSQH